MSGVKEWYDAHPVPTDLNVKDALLPEIRAIYSAAASNFSAADAWSDAFKMMCSQRLAQVEYEKMNVLVVPTIPMHPTKVQYLADPIALNHKLGKVSPASAWVHPGSRQHTVLTLNSLVYTLCQYS